MRIFIYHQLKLQWVMTTTHASGVVAPVTGRKTPPAQVSTSADHACTMSTSGVNSCQLMEGKDPSARCKGQDQHQCKLGWDAATTCNYVQHHHHRPDQDWHINIGVPDAANNATCIRACRARWNGLFLPLTGTNIFHLHSWCMVSTCCNLHWWCYSFSISCANTPLACVVVITHCNLHWWCFSFQPLAQILHLHSCNLHCVVAGGCMLWWYVYGGGRCLILCIYNVKMYNNTWKLTSLIFTVYPFPVLKHWLL